MDHPAPVSIVDRLGDRGQDLGRISARERAAGQPMRQALAVDEGHGEEVLPLMLPDLEDGDDPGMVEVGGRLGLGVEPPDRGLVGELAGADHLQGDLAVEADLIGLEHDAHAAVGHLPDDLVVAEVADP